MLLQLIFSHGSGKQSIPPKRSTTVGYNSLNSLIKLMIQVVSIGQIPQGSGMGGHRGDGHGLQGLHGLHGLQGLQGLQHGLIGVLHGLQVLAPIRVRLAPLNFPALLSSQISSSQPRDALHNSGVSSAYPKVINNIFNKEYK